MWFYKATIFTSFSYLFIRNTSSWLLCFLLHCRRLFCHLKASTSSQNGKIKLNREIAYFGRHFDFSIVDIDAVHKLRRYENKMALKTSPAFALNHCLAYPVKVIFLRSSCVMKIFTSSPLRFKLEILAFCQYYYFTGFDSCISSVLSFGEGCDSWRPLQGHDFQFV